MKIFFLQKFFVTMENAHRKHKKQKFQHYFYKTIEKVSATILMAPSGSTMSRSLSFCRTQSGANL